MASRDVVAPGEKLDNNSQSVENEVPDRAMAYEKA